MSEVILLGPQHKHPTAPASVRGLEGPIVAITAGWQENENDSLPGALDTKSSNLEIYRRAEQVFDRDPELAEAHRGRQLRLKELQRLYRLRLDHAMEAYNELMTTRGDAEILAAERQAALDALRALDRHHLGRVRAGHEEFEAQ